MPKVSADALNPCQSGCNALVAQLKALGVDRLGIAYSGGADSTALLLAAVQSWPGHVIALHINHGMQAAAVDFERHCQAFCSERSIPLRVANLQVQPALGESPEDAARKARYAAVQALCAKNAIKNVALAHHADDQAETLLLALSRGAGLPGLAAMAVQFERGGVVFHRPVLTQNGTALRSWLAQMRIPFVSDPSNANEALTRNKIRHQLLPTLERAFPAFRQTLARSARHAAQAQVLLVQLAQEDALLSGLPPRLKALQALRPERQANLLRYWLQHDHRCAPSAAQLSELLKQIAACTTRGHHIHLKIASGAVQRVGLGLQYSTQPPPV